MLEHLKSDVIRVHVCISGFTQTGATTHGVLKLSEKLIDAGHYNKSSRVFLQTWNTNWSEFAERLWQLGETRKSELLINIYAYSWGVGHGAVEFCRQLQHRGLNVRTLVACDGVFRHPLLVMRWTSLLRRAFSPFIRIPSNVTEVYRLHQRQNRPQGSEIEGDDGFSGSIYDSMELNLTHQYMDDAPLFHRMSLAAAESLLEVR